MELFEEQERRQWEEYSVVFKSIQDVAREGIEATAAEMTAIGGRAEDVKFLLLDRAAYWAAAPRTILTPAESDAREARFRELVRIVDRAIREMARTGASAGEIAEVLGAKAGMLVGGQEAMPGVFSEWMMLAELMGYDDEIDLA
jgi:hypothetical protein